MWSIHIAPSHRHEATIPAKRTCMEEGTALRHVQSVTAYGVTVQAKQSKSTSTAFHPFNLDKKRISAVTDLLGKKNAKDGMPS